MTGTKGIFHAKKGTIKDRNDMDLTEAEDIRKRWLEHREELYIKDLHDLKWALGSIITNKTSGSDGIPVEPFQILTDDVVKVLLNTAANSENSAVATGLE